MGGEPTPLKPVSPEQVLFAEALQCATIEARAAYLDGACGADAALRRRLEDLLRAAENAGDFLEEPPTGLRGDPEPTPLVKGLSEKPGDRIGRYKLLETIGEGGCGVVYMAEQEEPVRRRVALKVIKLGMDTCSVVGRFEAERQALALMDHPNIAKVFDGGATQTGRPYFVMELVRGVRITEFCDEARLPTEARLRLFVQVCQAVQHAHQKGIIHRDLKPSNILVTVNDGAPVPKVIDFGIAKATGQRLTDKTVFTQFHAFIGTPAYTSPEQAEMSSVDIDTRSDIYSLGVLLYELLTGRTPFDGEQMLRSGLDEMRRIIREDQPPRPSTRLTNLVAADVLTRPRDRIQFAKTGWPEGLRRFWLGALLRLGSQRGGSAPLRTPSHQPKSTQQTVFYPAVWSVRRLTSKSETDGASPCRPPPTKELISAVRGDLDCVVMKCLEKDRARRYETAIGLAADIQRHLDNEPVMARPPSGPYRLRKFVRRNKGAFAAALAMAVVLLLGVFASTLQAIRARRAEREQTELRQQAETSNRDLRDTVNLLELQRAEDLFRMNDASAGVAHLAAMLRHDPSNHVAANRLVSALVHRNWALPSAAPMRHLDRVTTATFSPDGRRVLSASWDRTAQVRDAITGQTLATVHHGDRILSARYNQAGDRFVTASADGTARIWNATNGVPITPELRHAGKVYWAEFSPDGHSVVTASADKTARIWNATTGLKMQKLSGHSDEVLMARFSPNGRQVATGSKHGGVGLWSTSTGQRMFRLDGHLGSVTAVAFSPDGLTVASASADHTARLWSTTTGQALGAPLLHNDEVHEVIFSPDGKLLLTTSQDYSARLWNATNGRPVGPPLRHEGGVLHGAFSPDGKMAATASKDNSTRLWDVDKGVLLCQPLRQLETVLDAEFSPGGRRLVTASSDGTAQVWNIKPRRFLGIEMRHEKPVTTVAFDPRGESVLSASVDQTARLWNARTGQALGQPMRHQGVVLFADYSPDGKRIVTGSEDCTAFVWDASTGQAIAGPLQHANIVGSVQFSPDGKRVATASADGTARIWDAQTGQPMTPPLEHGAPVTVARFSPDGRWVVTGSENGSARVWDAQTGQPVTERLQHADHVGWAVFSPDSQRVVSASSDNTARIWDVRTGKPIGPPLQHARTVEKAVFSPDGRRVVTASLDRTARVWDANTGEALTQPLMHDGSSSVSQVCFSPDGRRILTASWAGMSRLWDADTGSPLTEWLDAGGAGFFDSTGRRIVSGAYSGIVRVWDAPAAPTPVPPWFLALAEAVSGTRLSARGNTELVSHRELEEAAGQLARVSEGDFYGRLGRWFLADPSQRSLSPF
jgi:WD40 repeat protein/serine/threonine protein kinase